MKKFPKRGLAGKRVLVRFDADIPIQKSKITDTSRLDASKQTIISLTSQGAKVILLAHRGRPKGEDKNYSLKPIISYLEKTFRKPITFIENYPGREAEEKTKHLKNGSITLCENIRFKPEEEKNNTQFAKSLAKLGDIFVNDAFATAHRKHASVVGLSKHLPAYVGMHFEQEIRMLKKGVNPKHPFIVVMGGAKLSTKLSILKALIKKADAILLGGAMVFTFYKAQGYEIGTSLVEESFMKEAKKLMKTGKIMLPVDITVAPSEKKAKNKTNVRANHIPKKSKGLDIGSETCELFKQVIIQGKTILWNGPLGYCEGGFVEGTKAIALALQKSKASAKIIAGGDTLAAVKQVNGKDKNAQYSTAGGAALEYVAYGTLPGIQVLEK